MRCLSMIFILMMTAACRPSAMADSHLANIPFTFGTLLIDKNADPAISGGIVQYRVYGSGDIFYSGEISYFAGGVLQEVQVPFNGSFKVKPGDVLSANYAKVGLEKIVNKATFKVATITQQEADLDAFVSNPIKADSSDAYGTLKVRLAESIITISDADISGTIYEGTPFETQLHLHLTAP